MLLRIWRDVIGDMERICRRDAESKAGEGLMKLRYSVEGGGSRRGERTHAAITSKDSGFFEEGHQQMAV